MIPESTIMVSSELTVQILDRDPIEQDSPSHRKPDGASSIPY